MDTQTNLFVDFVFSFDLRPASLLKTLKILSVFDVCFHTGDTMCGLFHLFY